MVAEWALREAKTALAAQAAKAVGPYALTGADLEDDLTGLTVTSLPGGVAESWFPFAVADLGGGVGRVVREVDTDLKLLTWQRPLLPSELQRVSLASAALSNPLAGAAVYIGGGRRTDLSVTLWVRSGAFSDEAIGHEYGSRAQAVSVLAGVRRAFVPQAGEDFETYGLVHLRLVEQVGELLEYGLPEDCAALLLSSITHDWGQELNDGPFIFAADLEALVTVDV